MAQARLGKLPPKYSFLLNPYSNVRLTKCPRCEHRTHSRKFALLIHIDEWGPLVLGKTGRYCTPCELIIVHQEELETELSHSPIPAIANRNRKDGYLVLGTVDRAVWKKSLENPGTEMQKLLQHMADFKQYLELRVQKGWQMNREE